MVKFKKKPTLYDYHGTPIYISKCGQYRLCHFRSGYVQPNGKAEKEYWQIGLLTKRNPAHWWVVHNGVPSRKEAKRLANLHNDLMVVQKQLKKKTKK